jgi:aminopeptidase N
MLACYEKYLGKYPFWNDGYALVETPYLGMEHQSAIAYGNKYKTGYSGTDFSRIGLDFDYIVIHETAHEWWGNSVSCNDIADMWIHESFATYTEAIYVECMFNKETALKYVNAKKSTVGNAKPIVGIYGVNEEGDGDMYNKGMLFLNTLRHVVDNDAIWWPLIKNMCDTTFKMKNIGYEDVLSYFNQKTGRQLGPVFEQYLKYPKIPTLEYRLKKQKGKKYKVSYRWNTDVAGFNLPVFISTNNGKEYKQFDCNNDWQEMKVNLAKAGAFKVNEEWMYINVKEQ